jgi:hypothetical protein
VNRRPSARAAFTMNFSVRCTPSEKERWERAAKVMDVTLADVAREAWNRLNVEMAKEEEKVKRWSKQ